jgi:hypothetical protein
VVSLSGLELGGSIGWGHGGGCEPKTPVLQQPTLQGCFSFGTEIPQACRGKPGSPEEECFLVAQVGLELEILLLKL